MSKVFRVQLNPWVHAATQHLNRSAALVEAADAALENPRTIADALRLRFGRNQPPVKASEMIITGLYIPEETLETIKKLTRWSGLAQSELTNLILESRIQGM